MDDERLMKYMLYAIYVVRQLKVIMLITSRFVNDMMVNGTD